MRCVAEAALDREALLKPAYGLRTNVYSYAKRDLRSGETLDGVGGYTCYGLTEDCAEGAARPGPAEGPAQLGRPAGPTRLGEPGGPGLPICLADEVTLTRDVAKDEKIFLDDVVYDPGRPDFAMHALAAAE
jgi:hypothetical protein